MILSYSKDQFESLIKSGTKIHTIREDKSNRWRVGMAIQHWRGNPRHMNTQTVYQFGVGVCQGIQNIFINPANKSVLIRDSEQGHTMRLSDDDIVVLARNDGFESVRQFWAWFHEPLVGKIIHFTKFKYTYK